MLYVYGKKHFWPKNSIYTNKALSVVITLVWWSAAFALFCYSISTFGFSLVLSLYIVPLLFFMGWLVLVTFLHHNDPEAIWYGNSQWTYVKVFTSFFIILFLLLILTCLAFREICPLLIDRTDSLLII